MPQAYEEKADPQQISTSKTLDKKPKKKPVDVTPTPGNYLGSGVAKKDFAM